jgi:steroid delta-isomerase-like uncharacterized protein
MSETDEAIIRCYYSDMFSMRKMDIAATDQYMVDDFVAHDLPLALEGREDYNKFVSMFATSFSELNHIDVRDIFSSDDKVVTRWSCTGKHTAEFMGIPASNRLITLKVIDIFRLAEGKIADLWQEIDIMGILEQISTPPRGGTT